MIIDSLNLISGSRIKTGLKPEKGKITSTDLYQLGYAYFKEKEFTKAISQFNQIIGENILMIALL